MYDDAKHFGMRGAFGISRKPRGKSGTTGGWMTEDVVWKL